MPVIRAIFLSLVVVSKPLCMYSSLVEFAPAVGEVTHRKTTRTGKRRFHLVLKKGKGPAKACTGPRQKKVQKQKTLPQTVTYM